MTCIYSGCEPNWLKGVYILSFKRSKRSHKGCLYMVLITDFLPANTIFNKKIFGEALKNKNFLEIAMVCRTVLKR